MASRHAKTIHGNSRTSGWYAPGAASWHQFRMPRVWSTTPSTPGGGGACGEPKVMYLAMQQRQPMHCVLHFSFTAVFGVPNFDCCFASQLCRSQQRTTSRQSSCGAKICIRSTAREPHPLHMTAVQAIPPSTLLQVGVRSSCWWRRTCQCQ